MLLSPRQDMDADQLRVPGHNDPVPFRISDVSPVRQPEVEPAGGVPVRSVAHGHSIERGSPSVVRGVSLSGVLQMLHLERKTCVLDVVSERRFGTLTLVNGELVDAEADGIEGEDAVYEILAWSLPQTTILESVTLFRHTVDLPLARLLVESVRRQDEANRPPESGCPSPPGMLPPTFHTRDLTAPETAAKLADWNRLVETLVITGAHKAAVIRAHDEHVLALASEFGGLVRNPSKSEIAELTDIARSARRWSSLVHPSVEEIVLRVDEQQLLICPVDSGRLAFVCVLTSSTASLDLARNAIRPLTR